MVRKISSLMAILALCLTASTASATSFVQAEPGQAVTMTVDTTLIPGATNVNFQPSSQVNMAGASETTSFGLIAGHEAVKGKEAGQNYGMASDSSNVFWLASPADFPTDFDDTNSATFSSWNRN